MACYSIPGREFIRYNAFAQKLGRLTRIHGGKTLQIAASDLIDLHEAKALDGATLRALAQALFDITVPS